MQAETNIPIDYLPGYEKARLIAPEMASNYVVHTLIGDPLGEALADNLSQLPPGEQARLIQAGMEREEDALRDAPASLRAFFKDAETVPDWVDFRAFNPGIRMFHRNSRLILVAFVAGVLIEGFTTNIAKSFFITGRVRDQGVRRLKQNNRHMMDIFIPGGLERDGEGWKLSVRIRIVHGRIRHLLANSDDWNEEAWGVPVSAAHLGYAISSFSARLLKHMKTLGADYTQEEYDSFMAIWRYTGYLTGIPETILFRDAEEALKLYDVGIMCEPSAEVESLVMAHSLVNSAPLVAGVSAPEERRALAQYVYRPSRSLIGKELADQLHFPHGATFGSVPWFRLQEIYQGILARLIPGRAQANNLDRFTSLLEASMFDEARIRYTLPDHVYAEESTPF